MRFASLLCLSLLVACGDTQVPSSPLDGGSALDAGTPAADATVAADASATPDADVLTDAGADDAGTADAGVTCPDGTERQGEACVDIDECQTDNGGCGDLSAGAVRTSRRKRRAASLTAESTSARCSRASRAS